ncbi:unnamed protein product, partial [Mesorhabditis spiculigera]
MDGSTALDRLPFSGNFKTLGTPSCRITIGLEHKPHKAYNDKSAPIKMTVRTLQIELLCPICLDLLTRLMTTRIWPDRKIYDDMQSKQAEIFTRNTSGMDALRRRC